MIPTSIIVTEILLESIIRIMKSQPKILYITSVDTNRL